MRAQVHAFRGRFFVRDVSVAVPIALEWIVLERTQPLPASIDHAKPIAQSHTEAEIPGGYEEVPLEPACRDGNGATRTPGEQKNLATFDVDEAQAQVVNRGRFVPIGLHQNGRIIEPPGTRQTQAGFFFTCTPDLALLAVLQRQEPNPIVLNEYEVGATQRNLHFAESSEKNNRVAFGR